MKKSVMVKPQLYKDIFKLVNRTDKEIVVTWGCDCAARVLPYFEKQYPNDSRPRLAIKAGRRWVKTGVFKMAKIRGASLAAHAAARGVKDNDIARSAARAAGQAAAAAHVKTHSVAAAMYAATVKRDAAKQGNGDKAVIKERDWQYNHLQDILKRK